MEVRPCFRVALPNRKFPAIYAACHKVLIFASSRGNEALGAGRAGCHFRYLYSPKLERMDTGTFVTFTPFRATAFVPRARVR